uniref:LigA n=1 Tax=Parastrongyloides trichosuri TaxID=131310 RepID=A0A0N4ZLB5_PARTI
MGRKSLTATRHSPLAALSVRHDQGSDHRRGTRGGLGGGAAETVCLRGRDRPDGAGERAALSAAAPVQGLAEGGGRPAGTAHAGGRRAAKGGSGAGQEAGGGRGRLCRAGGGGLGPRPGRRGGGDRAHGPGASARGLSAPVGLLHGPAQEARRRDSDRGRGRGVRGCWRASGRRDADRGGCGAGRRRRLRLRG